MKNLLTIGLLIGLSLWGQAQAITPPDLICATRATNGDVTLTWELPVNTCGPFVSYDIYHSNTQTGPYTLLTAITNPATVTYLHVGANCNVQDNFYYMVSNYNCPGGTAFSSDTLDCEDPVAPVIDYVSVFNGGVELYWTPSPSPETAAYIIYRDDGGFNPIDTVFGRLTSFYFDNAALPDQRSERYTVAAMDACGNTGPFYNFPHQTILLDSSRFNCEIRIDLDWTPYVNWPNDSILEHRLLVGRNGAPASLDTTLPHNSFDYTFTDFVDGEELCLTVAAVDPTGNFVSRSNAICFTVNIVQPARYLYVKNATVTDSSVLVTYLPDPTADYLLFEILRSTNNSAYSVINVENAPGIVPPERQYEDVSSQAVNGDRYYAVETTDSCGNNARSGFVRTMHLDGIGRPNFSNKLDWNPFEITHGTVTDYEVFAWDEATNSGTSLGLVAPGTSARALIFEDDISAFATDEGRFCYRVQARGDLSFPNGMTDNFVSWSNVECVRQSAIIHVPTAMVPEGTNNFFKPVISFANPDKYLMVIFNRWGERLFETRDIDTGWDGTYNNNFVQQGVYAYYIVVTGANGNEVQRKGTFMVIR